eukprot:334956-Amphidinium_carterae.1
MESPSLKLPKGSQDVRHALGYTGNTLGSTPCCAVGTALVSMAAIRNVNYSRTSQQSVQATGADMMRLFGSTCHQVM